MIIYDLEATFDANKFLDAAYAKKMHFIIKSQNDLHLLRYEKNYITSSNIPTLGLLRSVITDGKKLICFSPPKSVRTLQFISKHTPQESIIEYYIEGTMINCYHYNGKWNFSTKGNID